MRGITSPEKTADGYELRSRGFDALDTATDNTARKKNRLLLILLLLTLPMVIPPILLLLLASMDVSLH